MKRQRRHTRQTLLQAPARMVLACLIATICCAIGAPAATFELNIMTSQASLAYADEAPASNEAADSDSSKSSDSKESSDDSDESSDNASGERKTPETDNLVDPTQRADNSFIYDTTIESLFEETSLNNGKIVQVVGEVIGDKIAADDSSRCWITLTSTNEDNQTTISVLLSEEQAKQIDHYGRYGVSGTKFQVRGPYHQACTEHEGLPDIHATDSAVVSRGTEHHDKLRLRRFVPGAVLVFAGLVLMGIYYFVREKMR